jgi:hypothetical protein
MGATKYWLIIIAIIFLVNPEKLPYYDVKSLINRQIEYLSSVSPDVQILAAVNGTNQEERKLVKSDSVFWARILNLVSKADINQPALRGAYVEKDSMINASKNFKLKSFYPKKKEDTNVLFLNVYYDSTLSHIQRLEAMVRDKNLLYFTERKINLSFDNYQGESRMTQYEVLGKQKIIFGDTIHFTTTIVPAFHD